MFTATVLGAVYKGRPVNGEGGGWFQNLGHSWTGGGGGL